jgi:hypothetical protein
MAVLLSRFSYSVPQRHPSLQDYRYQNYFIYLYFDIDAVTVGGKTYQSREPGGLTIAEIEPILRALDERVAEKLALEGPMVTP